MGVYLPKGKDGKSRSPFYLYDFWIRPAGSKESKRFHGSTGQRTEKEARKYEQRQRELAALGQLSSTMTVNEAVERLWAERAINQRSADDQATVFEQLKQFYGADTRLVDIGPNAVSEAALKRARTPVHRYNRRTDTIEPTKQLPKPATVNRMVVEPMRRLLRHAKKAWELPIDLEKFDWGVLSYEEPADRVRELSVEEELRFWDKLRDDYHPICEMFIISGRRKSDWVGLKKFKVDRTAGVLRVPTRKRKEQGEITVELTARELEIICEEWDKAPHCEDVFTYVKRQGEDAGKRYAITVPGLRRVVTNAFRAAKIDNFRTHDFRHTFANRALRGKGNLRQLMTALDHQDIASTMRYAHADQKAAREMRDAVQVNKVAPANVVPLGKIVPK